MLESARAVDTIVLDKTGTVTTGKMSLADVAAAPGLDTAELLRDLPDGGRLPAVDTFARCRPGSPRAPRKPRPPGRP